MPGTLTMTPEAFERWLAKAYTDALAMPTKPAQLRAIAVKARADIQDHFQQGVGPDGTPWKPLAFARPRGGTKPLLDTGRLRASFQGAVIPEGVSVGTNHPQAGIQNDGGTIRAKKKFLAIPLTRQAQLAGSPLRFGKPLVFRGNNNKGAWMEVRGKGKRAKLIAQWALVTSVKIESRPFLYWSEDFLHFAETMIADLMATQFLK